MQKEGKINIRTLCEASIDHFQEKKREQIPVDIISHKFSIDEHWILRNCDRFEFVRNETLDFCSNTMHKILRESAPEKSDKLYFWIGWLVGIMTIGALVLFQVRDSISLWLR